MADNRDIHQEILDASSDEERDRLLAERQAKENSMRAEGSWDSSWVPTSVLVAQVSGPASSSSSSSSGRSITGGDLLSGLQSDLQKQMDDARNSQLAGVEAQYEQLAQNAYIERMRSEANLPTLMQSAGLSGGMAESSAIAPALQYGSTLSSLGRAQAQAQQNINQAADTQALELAIQMASQQLAQFNTDRAYDSQQWQAAQNSAFEQQQWDYTLQSDAQKTVQSSASALQSSGFKKLGLGVLPSASELAAMGMSEQQARAAIAQNQ